MHPFFEKAFEADMEEELVVFALIGIAIAVVISTDPAPPIAKLLYYP